MIEILACVADARSAVSAIGAPIATIKERAKPMAARIKALRTGSNRCACERRTRCGQ
jgi:hypothetical protein